MLRCRADAARAADVARVGEGPFITGGGYFIAREKGYFKKLDIDIQPREFQDGSLAVPSMVAGELEFAGMTAAASLFNSVAKGAPLVVILDRATIVRDMPTPRSTSRRSSMTLCSLDHGKPARGGARGGEGGPGPCSRGPDSLIG